jgi:multicomponent Na+:H+ antiporter subunit B
VSDEARQPDPDRVPIKMRVQETVILRVVGKSLTPFVILFALYVQFHGDYGPGGGFQAGVILAAGLILHGLIFGLDALRKAVPTVFVEIGIALGALLYGGVGVVSMVLGGSSVSGASIRISPRTVSISESFSSNSASASR